MNAEQTADLDRRAAIHAALADPTRLRIVDLLFVSDLTASQLGAELRVPSNLLAHHLKTLEQVGLLTRRRSEGDGRRWYLSRDRDRATADLGPTLDREDRPPAGISQVLFVCTANTARSHLAAALWRNASELAVDSAGTHPGARINPMAKAAAKRHGLRLPNIAPRALEAADCAGQLLITVCDRAREELGDRAWAHWSIPDPVSNGTPAAFDIALEALATRVDELAPHLASAS